MLRKHYICHLTRGKKKAKINLQSWKGR